MRTLDPSSNATVSDINYRIVIDLHGTILLDQRFKSGDGIVEANLHPAPNANVPLIDGKQMATGEQVETSPGKPVEITSKLLSAGGLYHVKAIIEKDSGGLQGLDSDISFDLYITVSTDQAFDSISTSAGPKTMVVTSYYDIVENFTFSNDTIRFEMPFAWGAQYSSAVPLVHMEVKFPKSIPELQVNSYRASVNGIELPERAILIDDYSSAEYRIVHFVLPRAILDMLSDSVPSSSTTMKFSLAPAGTPKFPIDIQSLPAGSYVFEISWGPKIITTGVTTTFAMNLQDVKTGGLVNDTGFDFVLRQNGTEMYRQHQYSGLGIYSEQYTFPKPGIYQLSAENINGQGDSAKMDLQVLKGNDTSTTSPASTNSKPSGCLIATAAFGSELTPQVQYLRNFRDQFVMKTESGSAFMTTFNDVYYSFSPQVADYERQHPSLQATVRALIYPLLAILKASKWSHHMVGGEFGTILAGAVAASLIGAAYLWPAGAVVPKRVRTVWFAAAVAIMAVAMAASLAVFPAALMYTTAGFVLVTAAGSSVTVPRIVKQLFLRVR